MEQVVLILGPVLHVAYDVRLRTVIRAQDFEAVGLESSAIGANLVRINQFAPVVGWPEVDLFSQEHLREQLIDVDEVNSRDGRPRLDVDADLEQVLVHHCEREEQER